MVEIKDIIMYTPIDIQNIFHTSKSQAYCLMHSNGFPTLQINRHLYVRKEALEKWIDTYTGRQFKI